MAQVDERLRAFIRTKLAEWGPDPVGTILHRGEHSIAVQLAADPRLDALCGWLPSRTTMSSRARSKGFSEASMDSWVWRARFSLRRSSRRVPSVTC